jgi:hypothetical protein
LGPSASDSGNGSGLTNIFSPVLAEILGENGLLHQLRVPCGLEPSIVQLDGCVLHFCSALGSLPITPVLSSAVSSPPFNLTSLDSTGIPGTNPQPTQTAPQDATGKPVPRSQSLPPLSSHAEPKAKRVGPGKFDQESVTHSSTRTVARKCPPLFDSPRCSVGGLLTG